MNDVIRALLDGLARLLSPHEPELVPIPISTRDLRPETRDHARRCVNG